MGQIRQTLGSSTRAEQSRPVLTVSQLSEIIRDTLEKDLPALWVVGEISNFRVPPSGHFYFTLKDDQCQIAAVVFRRQGQNIRFQPENGMEVVCYGRVGLYPVRGDLQFYVEAIEPRGRGALQVAFEQLKARLWQEGLFATERKRPLPFLPASIGIVTSLQGAAVRDILRILNDRFPDRRVVIRPVKVQGDGAAAEIANAIYELGNSGVVDVMIVGRGGGSVEDLWSFNEEVVARALAAAPVPVISAVGHEVDFTIADLVADQRAPTPTAAAEMVIPSKEDLVAEVRDLEERLRGALQIRVRSAKEECLRMARRLADPRRRLRERQVRLDELSLSLWRRFHDGVERAQARVTQMIKRLGSVSPLAVLERGYSLVHKVSDGAVVKDSDVLAVGELVDIRFARGRAVCKVEEKN
jgi:exodeoxyribonuclease VII large subunit